MAIENRDLVWFYDGKELIAGARSSMVPPVGAKISIRREVWIVVQVTYALDYSDSDECGMRANVDLTRDA